MTKWIFILCCFFYCSGLSAQQIKDMEYFFDAYPVAGSGNHLQVNPFTDTVRVSLQLPTSGLNEGMHTLYVRSKTDSGWGLTESFPFYIKAVQNSPAILRAKYFIDADPGVNAGIVIPTGALADTVRLAFSIPSTGLTPGMHSLNIRSVDNAGNYSLFESFPFYITNEIANMPKITAAEYFFEHDPGVNMGTPLNINPPGDTVLKSFSIPVGCLNADSLFHLYVRMRDESGNWSLVEADTFRLHGPNTIVTTHSGLWSDPTTWSNNTVPGANTEIILSHDIIIDINATCKSLYTHCNNVHVNAGKLLLITGQP